ncbi:protein BIG GRAIN 1-like E [Argentina anserina]|uniref:protein BIG GRAIN 1-like E n=1 Tax=Argentina anserina TaxID=57926 RepID=UPI0021768025|nr:protein BIG GRAIN 1-like E [Potentilla anserina]
MSSVAGFTDPAEKAHKKSFHRRNDSGELDVFEAARYFSGYNELPTTMMKEDRSSWRGGRMSLDMPIRNVLDQQLHLHHHHHHHHAVDQKQNMKEKIKYKQPSSPGGRLASFLNSLFNQSGSKKKKSKSKSSTQSMKDEEESPGGRRRRRSSISHFRNTNSTTNTTDAKSTYSSSSSGFRTPPPYSAQITTTKSYKDWRSYSDHKPQQQVVSNLSKQNVTSHAKSSVSDEKVSSNRELNWLDEKFKYNNRLSLSEKYKNSTDQDHNKGLLKRLSEVVDDDDGAESDSSSDLFELQNYDLGGYCSSGLPVYETTNVDSIKSIRGTPIANAS